MVEVLKSTKVKVPTDCTDMVCMGTGPEAFKCHGYQNQARISEIIPLCVNVCYTVRFLTPCMILLAGSESPRG